MHKLDDLKIWNKAMDLATHVYEVTKEFPSEEKFNLISQMRRCAVSIPSNIAEGAGRNSDKQFELFLSHASGSTYELMTQTLIAKRTKIISSDLAQKLVDEINEIQKMNRGLVNSLKRNEKSVTPSRY